MWPSIALSRPPVAFVVGTTGAGKTKLAVQLASKFSGEIVNADAIQLYKGLSVASAKVTVSEAASVPHHLFSFLTPTQEFSVREFAALAGAAIDDIHARGKLPVVVGGTMYYTQALLSHTLLDDASSVGAAADSASPSAQQACAATEYTMPDGSKLLLGGVPPNDTALAAAYAELERVDPLTAGRLHRHDWRKVTRGLQVWATTGKTQSQLYREQAEQLQDWTCPYSVRVLWPHTERGVLSARLDARVEGMLQDGLLQEIKALHAHVQGASSCTSMQDAEREAHYVGASPLTQRLWKAQQAQRPPPSVPRDGAVVGALQAIGFREFGAYLHATETGVAAATAPKGAAFACGDSDAAACGGGGSSAPGSEALLAEALDTLRLRTRQYAMKQLSWIRNRFIKRGLTVHELDSSDVQHWEEHVAVPAEAQVADLLQGTGNDAQSVPSAADAERLEAWSKYTCAVCGVECVGPNERRQHLGSGKHRRAVAAAHALPRQWLAMYSNLRSKGLCHDQAQNSVQAVPRFTGLNHAAAVAAAGDAPAGAGVAGVKRRRGQ